MKTNLLKKIQIGNPLINLGLNKLYEEHEATRTDEELATFYYRVLDCVEGSQVAENFVYAMIAFSIGIDINPLILLINKHDN